MNEEVRSSRQNISSQQKVLVEVFGSEPRADIARLTTETRYGTELGSAGSWSCRRVAVTLPYSGCMDGADQIPQHGVSLAAA